MGYNAATRTFDLASDIRLQNGTGNAKASLLGLSSVNDGYGGSFFWDASSVLSDDNVNVFKSPATTGRWRREQNDLNFLGNGSPEGVVTAPIGATYKRLDGSAGATLYSKESGTGNTGWVVTGTGTSGVFSGSYTATGDGVTSQYSWNHGLGFDPTTSGFTVDPATNFAQGIYSKTADSTKFYVNYDVCPTGSLIFNWTAKKP